MYVVWSSMVKHVLLYCHRDPGMWGQKEGAFWAWLCTVRWRGRGRDGGRQRWRIDLSARWLRCACGNLLFYPWQDDEVVLQCVACIQKENRKFCLTAEGLGNRLCYLEPTSEAKVRNPTPTPKHTHTIKRKKKMKWSTNVDESIRCWPIPSPRTHNR